MPLEMLLDSFNLAMQMSWLLAAVKLVSTLLPLLVSQGRNIYPLIMGRSQSLAGPKVSLHNLTINLKRRRDHSIVIVMGLSSEKAQALLSSK